jgi:glyoxylase-like metal-dependent hydrolase (beta-lactamase superfamily II)
MILEKGIYAYLWRNMFENNCNSYILGEEKAILVDVGHQRHVDHLRQGMEEDAISVDTIDLIIITHCHPDHHEAVPSFLDGRVKVAYHREEENYLRQEGGALYQMMGAPIPSISVEFYLQEGNLQVGGNEYQILHTPGHSPGAICIYWPPKKVLVTGDLLFAAGVGRTDFPGGDGKQLIESIEKVRKLDVEILLPGHGEIVSGKDRIRENFEVIEQNYYAFL